MEFKEYFKNQLDENVEVNKLDSALTSVFIKFKKYLKANKPEAVDDLRLLQKQLETDLDKLYKKYNLED